MWVLEARKDRIIKKSKDKTIRTAEVEIFSIILKVVSKIRIRLLLISVCVCTSGINSIGMNQKS